MVSLASPARKANEIHSMLLKMHARGWGRMRDLFADKLEPTKGRQPCVFVVDEIHNEAIANVRFDDYTGRPIITFSKEYVEKSNFVSGGTTRYPIIGFDLSSQEPNDFIAVPTEEQINFVLYHEIAHVFHTALLYYQLPPEERQSAEAIENALHLIRGEEYSYCREKIADFAAFLCAMQNGEYEFTSVLLAKRLAVAHFVDQNPLYAGQYVFPFGINRMIRECDRQRMDAVFAQYRTRTDYARARSALGITGIARKHSADVLRIVRIGELEPDITLADLCLYPFRNNETPEEYVRRRRSQSVISMQN